MAKTARRDLFDLAAACALCAACALAAPAAVAQQSVDRAVGEIVANHSATTAEQARRIVGLAIGGGAAEAEARMSAAVVNRIPHDDLLDAALTTPSVTRSTRRRMIEALLRSASVGSGDTAQSLVGRATHRLVNDPARDRQAAIDAVQLLAEGGSAAVFDGSLGADPLFNAVAVGSIVDAVIANAIDEITGEPTDISAAAASAAVRGAAAAAPAAVDGIASQSVGAVDAVNGRGGAQIVYVNPTTGAIVPASAIFAVAALSGAQLAAATPGAQASADPVADVAAAFSQVVADGDELDSLYAAIADLSAGAYTKETLRSTIETAAIGDPSSPVAAAPAPAVPATGVVGFGGLTGLPIIVIETLASSSGFGSSEAQDLAPSAN